MKKKHEHNSIRKFAMGAASVLIGLTFMGSNSRPVKASKTKKNESEIVLVESQSTDIDKNAEKIKAENQKQIEEIEKQMA